MKKKYEFTQMTKVVNGHTLTRIRALRDFGNIKAGELGGYIEDEYNLSHEGGAWVGDKARVYGGARVFDDAVVYGYSTVSDCSQVLGKALVYGTATVKSSMIRDIAWVYGEATLDCARVFENAKVYDQATVKDGATLGMDCKIHGNACVKGDIYVKYADVNGDTYVSGM